MRVYLFKTGQGKRAVLFRPARFSFVPQVYLPDVARADLRDRVRAELDAMARAPLHTSAEVQP